MLITQNLNYTFSEDEDEKGEEGKEGVEGKVYFSFTHFNHSYFCIKYYFIGCN